jgi:predicted TIM-barrel fold metal-dependent hydrolase
MNYPITDRRNFLKVCATASAAAIGSSTGLVAQGSAYKVTARGGSIDVHHHHTIPNLGGGGRGGAPTGTGGGRAGWTPQRSIEQMDKFGIAASIMSLSMAGEVLYDKTERGRTAVRTANDFAAKMMQDYPKRFGMFASIPFPDVEGSLREIAYAYDTLKADGISIYTNDNQGHWAGDPVLEPIWQELGRRKAVILMHPWVPACCTNLTYGTAATTYEVDFETSRAVTNILLNGVLFRYPDIKLITVHAGGSLPALSGRMEDRVPNDKKQYMPNGFIAELKKLYYDTADATYKAPWTAMTAIIPPTQILFGTDYGPVAIERTTDHMPALGLSRNVLEMVERGNAERLLPRFKV